MPKLKYIVKILYNDRLLAMESKEANEKILDLYRERQFQMAHTITMLGERCVQKALAQFDKENNNEETTD